MDYGVIDELRAAHKVLVSSRKPGEELPVNTRAQHGITLMRRLDCAVFETLHKLREEFGGAPYDTIMGVFEEEDWAFAGAGFKAKTHMQLAVRNPDVIVGYFRVDTSKSKLHTAKKPRS